LTYTSTSVENTETIAPPFAYLEYLMGYSGNPNGSDLSIVTVVLQYSVFATLVLVCNRMGGPLVRRECVIKIGIQYFLLSLFPNIVSIMKRKLKIPIIIAIRDLNLVAASNSLLTIINSPLRG
jgi:hypothetical protein